MTHIFLKTFIRKQEKKTFLHIVKDNSLKETLKSLVSYILFPENVIKNLLLCVKMTSFSITGINKKVAYLIWDWSIGVSSEKTDSFVSSSESNYTSESASLHLIS